MRPWRTIEKRFMKIIFAFQIFIQAQVRRRTSYPEVSGRLMVKQGKSQELQEQNFKRGYYIKNIAKQLTGLNKQSSSNVPNFTSMPTRG